MDLLKQVGTALAASGSKAAQDAQLTSGPARLLQGLFERIMVIGFDIQIELILEGLAVDGAALDFEEIDAVFGEGLKGGKEGAGLVSEAHGQGDFCGTWLAKLHGLIGREKQDEAGEVFRVILDAFAEDNRAVVFRGTASSDGRAGFISARHHFADAAGGVFGGDTLEIGVRLKEALALRKSHGMRSNGAQQIEGRAGASDEVMFDGENGFAANFEGAFQQEVINAHDGACQGVFERQKQGIGDALRDGAEGSVKGGARNRVDGFTEQLHCCGLAEGAGLALKGNAHRFEIHFAHDWLPKAGMLSPARHGQL